MALSVCWAVMDNLRLFWYSCIPAEGVSMYGWFILEMGCRALPFYIIVHSRQGNRPMEGKSSEQ